MHSSLSHPELNHLREENRRLRRAVEELSVLNEIATAINSTLPLDRVLELVLKKCVRFLEVEQGVIMLVDASQEEGHFTTKIRKSDSGTESLPFRLDTQVTGWMLRYQKPLLVNNLLGDERFTIADDDNEPARSLLSVPLIAHGRMIGLLILFNKKDQQGFTAEDQRLLAIIATQSAQVIEHARLFAEEKDLLLIQEEMTMAFEIQTNLLPKTTPGIRGYDIAGMSLPARVVGGDYFDFIPVTDDRLAFCLGDATGKGIAAALLMANLQATVRGQALTCGTAQECLIGANAMLFHSTSPEKFATLFFGYLDHARHRIRYSNAGHNYPFFLTGANPPRRLEAGGIVLGCLEVYPYEEDMISLEPGDMLVVYSDGITEACDTAGEEFGDARLEELVIRYRHHRAKEAADRILQAVAAFRATASQVDDMTILVIKRDPAGI